MMSANDPVTLEVVGNFLVSTVREMNTTVTRTAYSTLIREQMDCSTALFDPQGQLIAQADHVPSHQGTMSYAAKYVAQNFSLDPGDIVLLNHPYRGGTHHPDFMVFKPVFSDSKLVAMAASLGHHLDVGGRSPGSVSTDARDVYEEGLLIPPLKLYKKGVVSEDVLAMIEANIRVPKKTMGDFRAQISGINVGEARFLELCRKYGTDRLTEIIKGVLDHSEAMMRRDLAAYADGTYSAEGFLDSDGIGDQPVRIAISVTLKGGTVTVDFTGTAAQLKGPFNCSISSVQAAVFCAVRYMVNPSILQNEGCYRPISLILPEGTLVNPRHPAPLSGRFHTLARIATTIALAFNQARGTEAVGANHGHLSSYSSSGRMPGTGETWVIFDILGGGWGGTSRCDGLDAVYDLMANCYDNPVEAMELDYPLRVEQCGFRTDSGGAGRNRGGLGLRKEIRYLHGEGFFTNRSDGQKFPPPGVLGGKPGLPASHALIRSGTRYEALPSKVTNLGIAAEDIIMMETPGGGGYGSPLERDARLVLDDVLDEKISREAAHKVYGLVLTRDGRTFDEAATAVLRQRLAAVSER